jgi:hypothetical protein
MPRNVHPWTWVLQVAELVLWVLRVWVLLGRTLSSGSQFQWCLIKRIFHTVYLMSIHKIQWRTTCFESLLRQRPSCLRFTNTNKFQQSNWNPFRSTVRLPAYSAWSSYDAIANVENLLEIHCTSRVHSDAESTLVIAVRVCTMSWEHLEATTVAGGLYNAFVVQWSIVTVNISMVQRPEATAGHNSSGARPPVSLSPSWRRS